MTDKMKLVAVALLVAFSNAAVVPVVHYIEPSSGLLSGGTEVCVTGENLALMQVGRVGKIEGELTYANPDGTKTCFRTPRGESPAVYTVQLSEDTGFSAFWIPETPRNSTFKYYVAPKILEVIPASGPATGNNEVKIKTDISFLASTSLHVAKCLFGTMVSPVTSYSCDHVSCYVTCFTPEMCKILDPVDEVKCQESTVPVFISLNGQDYTTDASTKPAYTFTNVWAHPA